jgi:hypothetical protein
MAVALPQGLWSTSAKNHQLSFLTTLGAVKTTQEK